MPRCYSCGKFTKSPHREFDGRTEKAYCDFCHAEREWKFEDKLDMEGGRLRTETPVIGWWDRLKQFFGLR